MTNYGELDGERINMDGIDDVTNMIALSAAQNIGPGIFDGDNFYPADGDYSDASGRAKGTIFDKKERAKRRAERQRRINERQKAKNEETQSRAELNRNIGKGNQGDTELAKALSGSTAPLPTDTTPASSGMSKTTKIMIGAGVGLVVLIVGVVLYKRFNK